MGDGDENQIEKHAGFPDPVIDGRADLTDHEDKKSILDQPNSGTSILDSDLATQN
jgi:hypothetical protein